MFRKWLFGNATPVEEPGRTPSTNKVITKRLQSPLGDNDHITPYHARSIDFNTPLKTSSEYLDGKQRIPDSDQGLLDDEDDDEVIDKGTGTDPGYVRKTWSIFFAIVCALIFAAVAGYALISFVFPPLWLLNIAALVGYLALDAVAAGIAAVMGYFTFNKLYDAYSLNWKKASVMAVLAIVTAAVLFTVISVISGGLFPLLSSIVLGAGLLFSTLSTFVFGLSLWSILKFGMNKVDGDANDSIQSISFYPADIVDFDNIDNSPFLSDNSIDSNLTEGDSYRIFYGEIMKECMTPKDSFGAAESNKFSAYFTPTRDDSIEKMTFNDHKYDEFIKLFEDKIELVENSGNDKAFVQFLHEKILLLKTPEYEELFRQEMESFNKEKYTPLIAKFSDETKKFPDHQLWFNKTIALFDKQDFAKQYDHFMKSWDQISNQSYDDNSTTNQAYDDQNSINNAPN